MTAPTISPLPELPTFPSGPGLPDQPGVFIPKFLTFLAALSTFREEANALGAYLDGLALGQGTGGDGGSSGGGGGGGAGGSTLPLGQVANRCYMPNKISGSSTTAMSRTVHFARDGITSLILAFPNWYVDTSSAGAETSTGGPKTVEAAIEYPAGTFTRITFAGGSVGTIADLTTLFSDECAVTIPNGAQFWVRSYVECQGSGKIVWSAVAAAGSILYSGGAGEIPATSNKVTGGTVTGTTPSYPCAIIGRTAKKSVMVIGDSRAFGESGDATMGDTGEIAPSVGVGVINAGTPSDRMAYFLASSALRRQLAAYCTDIICEYGINDIRTGGATVPVLQSTAAAVYALFPGKRVWQSTLEPSNTSTDNWVTVANQAVSALSPIRTAFNDWIRLLFDNSVDLTERVVNGAPGAATTGWSSSAAAAPSIVNVSGVNYLRVTNTAGGLGRVNSAAAMTTVVGQKYVLEATAIAGTAPDMALRIGTTQGGNEIAQISGPGRIQAAFTATSTTTWISLANGSATTIGQYSDWIGITTAADLSTALAGYFDVADALENSRNDGKWKVNGTANYITNDGLHPNQTGYALVASSGAISPFTS